MIMQTMGLNKSGSAKVSPDSQSSEPIPFLVPPSAGQEVVAATGGGSGLPVAELLRQAEVLTKTGGAEALSQAAGLIGEAARLGDAEAQFKLGVCYAHGRGLAQDYAKSVHWLKLAAGQNHPGAQDSLGVRYATGQGVTRDDSEAVRWFRRASEQGHAVAQFNLGLAYVYGQGVVQSYQQAFVWFSLSAMQGDDIASESRDRVAEALTFEELQQAKVAFHQACRTSALPKNRQV